MIVYVHIRFLHKRPVSLLLIQYKSKLDVLQLYSTIYSDYFKLSVVWSVLLSSLSAYDNCTAIYTLIPGGAASAFNL